MHRPTRSADPNYIKESPMRYSLAALLLFVGFSWFLWAKFSFFGWPPIAFFAAPAIIYVTIVIQSVLGIYRITKLRKDSGERARG